MFIKCINYREVLYLEEFFKSFNIVVNLSNFFALVKVNGVIYLDLKTLECLLSPKEGCVISLQEFFSDFIPYSTCFLINLVE